MHYTLSELEDMVDEINRMNDKDSSSGSNVLEDADALEFIKNGGLK